MLSIKRYISLIAVTTIVVGAFVYSGNPVPRGDFLNAALVFGSIGLLARFLSHRTSRDTQGSIAFIPVLASAAIAPHWLTMVVAAAAAFIGQRAFGKDWLKTAFNTSQYALSIGAAILAYRIVGGLPLHNVGESTALSLVVLFLVFLGVNSASVSGVIAIVNERDFFEVWKKAVLGDLAYDFLSLPIVLFFVWAYASFGPMGALFLAVPLLGIRQLYIVKSKLEQTNRELLELMVAAIEARDPYTSGHSRRVAANSRIISEAIGLKERETERIAIAALLHDVGKIHDVFGPILNKPGRLTPEENAIMKTHPIKSEELAATVSELKDVLPLIRHHHENWDGSGYPDAIAGEAIPLGSRIIMFADTIDAMTTDRPYRAALGEAAVRSEMKKFRGTQFDPAIYDRLLASPEFSRLFSTGKEMPLRSRALPAETLRTPKLA